MVVEGNYLIGTDPDGCMYMHNINKVTSLGLEDLSIWDYNLFIGVGSNIYKLGSGDKTSMEALFIKTKDMILNRGE